MERWQGDGPEPACWVLAVCLGLAAVSAAGAPARTAVPLTSSNLGAELASLHLPENRKSYVITEPITLPQVAGASEVWYVANLTFEPDGVLYTAGKDFTLSIGGVLQASPNQTVIASFPEAQSAAAKGSAGANGADGRNGSKDGKSGQRGKDGQAGQPGVDGAGGGRVTLQLAAAPSQRIVVSLPGQSGGPGGNGGNGGQGGDGGRGRAGKSGVFGCDRGGGDGGRGGDGGNGGNAGPGGRCGQGGELIVIVPERLRKLIEPRIVADAQNAKNGPPGQPGKGGRGGQGGKGGQGSGFCGGGDSGSRGRPGRDGSATIPAATGACSPTMIRFLPL